MSGLIADSAGEALFLFIRPTVPCYEQRRSRATYAGLYTRKDQVTASKHMLMSNLNCVKVVVATVIML